MSIFSEWPHKWFGFWASASSNKASTSYSLPLITEFLEEKHRVVHGHEVESYLLNAPRILTVPTSECVFERDNLDHVGTLCLRTDGEWLWWDNIVHYMIHHHLRLPDALIEHIGNKDFEPPKSLELTVQDMLERLEWPVIPGAIAHAPKTQVVWLKP